MSTLLVGCGAGVEGGESAPVDRSPRAANAPLAGPRSQAVGSSFPRYRVHNEQCPQGWTGLWLETDNPAEVEYLDDMPVCTDASGTTSYLENKTDAVWVLSSTTVAGTWTADPLDRGQASFLAATQGQRAGAVVLAPGESGTVDLPADGIRWDIDLALSFGWQAHGIVVKKIESAGEAALVAALERRSPAGAALATCTLAATTVADETAELDEADAAEVLMTGLAAAAAGGGCARAASQVAVVDEQSGKQVALSTELGRLSRVTTSVETAHTRLSWVQDLSKLATSGARWIAAVR